MDRLLLDFLALLILLHAELFQLLLLFLIDARVDVVRPAGVSRTRRRRSIIAHPRIASVARGIASVARGIARVAGGTASGVGRSVAAVNWRIHRPIGRIR